MTDHREGRADARSPHGVSRDDGTPDARIAHIARRQHAVAHEAGTPDARIAHIARRQHGVVSRRQALEAGLGGSTIHRRVTAGLWTRLHQGVYRVVTLPSPLEWASGASLAGGPDALVSYTSAAYLHGWIAGEAPRPVHLSIPRPGPRTRAGLRVHRVEPLQSDEIDCLFGVPVTSRGRTLIDLAPVVPKRDLERIVAHVQRNDELSAAQLDTLAVRYRGRRGARKLREIIEQPGGARFTRSEAEARFLGLIRTADLPVPDTNVLLGPYELDAVWPRERVVVEVDGYAFHRSRDQFEADRRKDAWLTARGYRVIRVTWRQMTRHPTRTAVVVGRALEAAKRTV
ncbi:type IV toxin-antitoxin system AbiEi family antitoxin domain-containing protein [Gaopeijia maritima]|uniref:Type IV toxin-antitoxin system AbiEi family antitoxin domain-containing protein n=1 Tax=Gaopeijia maritima TaxID=3119007 RepID=A0ABU9ED29_9BACT